MTGQAGVSFFDQRPVPPDFSVALGGQGRLAAPGLLLAVKSGGDAISAPGNALAFDGRLDNREDLLMRLRTRIDSRCDSALALSAYEAWGVNGLVHLIGDWSIAVWEPAAQRLVLASDFAGVRPLYYHANRERVVWSSDLKWLAAVTKVSEIDDVFVAGLLTGAGSPNRTPYREILPVPGGCTVVFEAGRARTSAFWSLPVHSRIRYGDIREYEEQLRGLFRESMRARLRTVHPVCSELSGGLDSSSIVCMAADLIQNNSVDAPRLISLSLGPRGNPDEKFYTAVRNFCGIEGMWVNTDDYPYLDPNTMDEAAPAPWGPLLNELAARAESCGAEVYLTGQGGDLLMGNWVNDSEQIAGRLRRGQFGKAVTESFAWSKATGIPAPKLLWRGAVASLPGANAGNAKPPVDRFGDSLTSRFKASTVEALDSAWSTRWRDSPLDRRRHFRSVSRWIESGLFRPPERLQHLAYAFPFAHRPLVEFLLAVPAEVLCRPSEPRRLMRSAFRELLPAEVAGRRSKASFTGEFLKSLRPAARALLSDSRSLLVEQMGYVDSSSVRPRLQRMTQSLESNEPQLRQVVLLEYWLRRRQGLAFTMEEARPAPAAAIF